jgi:hypothetical protein
MEWKYKRQLAFIYSEKGSLWFCERCGWNRALPALLHERSSVTSRVQVEFDAHDCEEFASTTGPSLIPSLKR